MMQLTRIEPASLAIVLALLGFFIGIITGLLGAALSFSSDAVLYILPLLGAERMDSLLKSVLMSMGPLTIVLMAFVCALVGFVGGFVTAVIYNLIAARFGGITLAFGEYVEPDKPPMREVKAEELEANGAKSEKKAAEKKEKPPIREEPPEQEETPQSAEQPPAQPEDEQYQEPAAPYQEDMERIERVVNQRPRRRQRP